MLRGGKLLATVTGRCRADPTVAILVKERKSLFELRDLLVAEMLRHG
jgi:hypothetical protein